jgi:hypothetical protein
VSTFLVRESIDLPRVAQAQVMAECRCGSRDEAIRLAGEHNTPTLIIDVFRCDDAGVILAVIAHYAAGRRCF